MVEGYQVRQDTYQNRFGNLSVREALRRVVRGLQLEAILQAHDDAKVKGLYSTDVGEALKVMQEKVQILGEAYQLLGIKRTPPLRRSLRPEIVESIDIISQQAGEDYSWLKAMIGVSPDQYIRIAEDRLIQSQRKLLLGILQSLRENPIPIYRGLPEKVEGYLARFRNKGIDPFASLKKGPGQDSPKDVYYKYLNEK